MKGQTRSMDRLPAGGSKRAKSMVLLAVGALMLLALACDLGTAATDGGTLTVEALDAQASTLAAQAQQLTAQAALQPTSAPPIVAPPTEATQPSESPYVEGSLVRAPYDPAAGFGEPDWYESFDGTSGLFATRSGGAANSWYGNGRYNITFVTRGMWTWYFGDPSAVDFYGEVLVFNGEQCVERDSAGLLFHGVQSVDTGLLFGVTCGGEYYFGLSGGPGPEGVVVTWAGGDGSEFSGDLVTEPSEYIDAGPGALNRLGIMTDGPQYSFYINGHLIDEYISPWTGLWFDKGHFALFLGTGQRSNASASFDEFRAWKNP
jgi:hypothetical protein